MFDQYFITSVDYTGTRMGASGAAPVIPATPTSLTAVADSDSIALNWTEHGTYDTVAIDRKSTGDYTSLIVIAGGIATYDDTTALDGILYTYRVRGTRNGYPSANSNEASDTVTFNPASIAGLVGQWDAANLMQGDGNGVDTWADVSGDGNDATQATAPNQPILRTTGGANSKPAVEFNNLVVPQYLSANTAAGYFAGNGGSQTTLFFVSSFTDIAVPVSSQYALFSTRKAAAATHIKRIYLDNGSVKMKVQNKNDAGTSVISVGATDLTANSFSIWCVRYDSSFDVANLMEIWKGGNLEKSEALAGNYTYDLFTMGADFQSVSATFGANAKICEALLYNTNISNSNINLVGNYLASKYNLTWTAI